MMPRGARPAAPRGRPRRARPSPPARLEVAHRGGARHRQLSGCAAHRLGHAVRREVQALDCGRAALLLVARGPLPRQPGRGAPGAAWHHVVSCPPSRLARSRSAFVRGAAPAPLHRAPRRGRPAAPRRRAAGDVLHRRRSSSVNSGATKSSARSCAIHVAIATSPTWSPACTPGGRRPAAASRAGARRPAWTAGTTRGARTAPPSTRTRSTASACSSRSCGGWRSARASRARGPGPPGTRRPRWIGVDDLGAILPVDRDDLHREFAPRHVPACADTSLRIGRAPGRWAAASAPRRRSCRRPGSRPGRPRDRQQAGRPPLRRARNGPAARVDRREDVGPAERRGRTVLDPQHEHHLEREAPDLPALAFEGGEGPARGPQRPARDRSRGRGPRATAGLTSRASRGGRPGC